MERVGRSDLDLAREIFGTEHRGQQLTDLSAQLFFHLRLKFQRAGILSHLLGQQPAMLVDNAHIIHRQA